MKLQKMFKSDINRSINGVIQVMQDDEENLRQELEEYVITKELKNHFSTFFDSYEKALNHPTDKIGVWIAGFFGSGKSHFLKMLSYLLENKVVAGKQTIEYFEDKFDDPMQFSVIEQCAKVPTETILFNIDSVASADKDKTVILRTFAKMFYEHLGYYGDDLKIAKLEKYIDKQGKTDDFHRVFESINGDSWDNVRDNLAFWEDDIVATLQQVLGMSEIAARNWFNGTETADISIDQLTDEIKEYVDSKGKNFRLLFMVDEIGQYIGGDGSLMLNLQTIVESLGSKCAGQVWVVVTSQEAVDTIVKIEGQDYSKIQARFNTRLSLSSSSVDEVIKKRVLAKTDSANDLLKMKYESQAGVLKNLYTFNTQVQDVNKVYSDSVDFAETFPFVPYQFNMVQKVMAEARRHGNTGKHFSGGERSMLSGYQEVAQKIQENDETAMAPFYFFYDSIHEFLEGAIQRVIEKCQREADDSERMIQQYDVYVLKTLYLIRYINEIKPTIENISILMIDSINASKITVKNKVAESLDRLVSQNYVSISGDTYRFLDSEEQQIEMAIRETAVDNGKIVNNISQTIFADIYQSKKFKYGKNDFSFDAYVDGVPNGMLSGGMKLEILTLAAMNYNAGDQELILQSKAENKAIIVMSDEEPYFEEIQRAAKIRKYVNTRNVSEEPESIQKILRDKQSEASDCEKRSTKHIAEAIQNGKFYVAGEKLESTTGSAADRINQVLKYLVESVYSKLDLVKKNYDSDSEIMAILNGTQTSLVSNPNQEAIGEVEQYLNIMKAKAMPVSMGDIHKYFGAIPFGWREIDIAAVVAELIATDKMVIKYAGLTIAQTDPKLIGYLRKASERDKALVERKVALPEKLIKSAQTFMKDYTGKMDVPLDEKKLLQMITDELSSRREAYLNLLNTEYAYNSYPQKDVVSRGANLLSEILSQSKDNIAYLTKLTEKADDMLDLEEDMQEVMDFFNSQKDVYNKANNLVAAMHNEEIYIKSSQEAIDALHEIQNIMTMAKPYRRISELPALSQTVTTAYDSMLVDKKEDVKKAIQDIAATIHQAADQMRHKEIIERADNNLDIFKKNADSAMSLTELDAMKPQVETIKDNYLKQIFAGNPDGGQNVNEVVVKKANLGYATKIKTEADIDEYVEAIRQELRDKLKDNDAVQII